MTRRKPNPMLDWFARMDEIQQWRANLDAKWVG